MREQRQAVLAWLEEEKVPYRLAEHPPAFTMEDIVAHGVDRQGEVLKNLFLRDSKKGKQHFLVSVRGGARVDLATLGAALGQRLSFASEQRLEKTLRLAPGAVTPLGALFDEDRAVQLWFDDTLQEDDVVGVHPADNTATVFLRFGDLLALLERHGSPVGRIAVPHAP